MNLQINQKMMMLWGSAQPIVASYVNSIVRNSHDAEDVIQQTAGEIVKHFERYDENRPFTAWAMGIARNKVREYCRSKAKDPLVFSEEIADVLGMHVAEHHDGLNRARSALNTCVAKLDKSSRRLVELRYTSAFKPGAIAERLGVSANTVRIRLHRIRQALESCIRRTLKAEGVTL